MTARMSPGELNRRHALFWENFQREFWHAIADPLLLEHALEVVRRDQARGTPMKQQITLEAVVAQFTKYTRAQLAARGRQGGRASKTDELQRVIEKIVLAEPNIDRNTLIHRLKGREHADERIFSVSHEAIEFADGSATKHASVSGIKDRLSRAKKKLKIKSHKAALSD